MFLIMWCLDGDQQAIHSNNHPRLSFTYKGTRVAGESAENCILFFFCNKNQAILVKTFSTTIHKRLMVFTGSAWLVNLWPLSIFYLFIYFLRRLLMESQIEKEQTVQHEMKISTESWCCTWLLQMKNLEKYLSLNYQKRRGCLQGGMFTLASGLNQLRGKR